MSEHPTNPYISTRDIVTGTDTEIALVIVGHLPEHGIPQLWARLDAILARYTIYEVSYCPTKDYVGLGYWVAQWSEARGILAIPVHRSDKLEPEDGIAVRAAIMIGHLKDMRQAGYRVGVMVCGDEQVNAPIVVAKARDETIPVMEIK
jgi:hypothetical protein